MKCCHYCQKRKQDDALFREYIENTTCHGVVRIFDKKKSVCKRIFWLLIVLGSSGGLLYNCFDRILFLASDPTSTSISVVQTQTIDFPAVTLCNLNSLTRDGLNQLGLLSLSMDIFSPFTETNCKDSVDSFPDTNNVILEDVLVNASHRLESALVHCTFKGVPCTDYDFVPILTSFGLCYTFNSGILKAPSQTSGSGIRQGLNIILDVQQDQYVFTPSLDAGMRILVHPQSQPPLPLDQGIAVPLGTNSFIGLTKRSTVDLTERDCVLESDVSGFNYLQNNFNYSMSACRVDCFLTLVANRCNCTYLPMQYPPEPASTYANVRNCTFHDVCCLQQLFDITTQECDCKSACRSIRYSTFTSYSSLPALYAASYLEEEAGITLLEELRENIVSLNVYMESLNVETITTRPAYDTVALLSDIGGQLGLFLGVSIISIMEFGTWVLDEFWDRCVRYKLKKVPAVEEMTEKTDHI